MATAPRLVATSISKRFPGVVALSDVDFSVAPGEICALVGENGAGKSTLMKILAGIESPDGGEVVIDGRVALIHQELNLADNLDVAANVFLGREPHRFGMIDNKTIATETRAVLARVGLDVAPNTPVSKLAMGQRQLVEVAKALAVDADVVLMDEPTSSLTGREAERLFGVIESLAKEGTSIVYISHRLSEVERIAHRVVVLRDGENAGELEGAEIRHDRIVPLMVGRELDQFYDHTPRDPGDVVLSVRGLETRAHPGKPLDIELRAGEIVGVFGLVGAGRTELLETIFGLQARLSGMIWGPVHRLHGHEPREASDAGLALVPEDRKAHGLVLDSNIRENMSLAMLGRLAKRGLINRAWEKDWAAEAIERLGVRTPDDRQLVRNLSGGNQQKVVIGKWLAARPRVLLLDEPTRGIDIGSKQQIYRLMERLAADGAAILFASGEMEELIGMSDRALVMHEGRITGDLPRDVLTEEAVMERATGMTGTIA